jgi:uncharacterized Zn-binding protein involved in type VI secretion
MGQPAARALIDVGAHTGIIMTGSINVFVGGGMAARKGDAVACSLHGAASIVGGSSSVYINGMLAARMGDMTSCGTPPMPAIQGPTQALDKIFHATPAQNTNEDGSIKTQYPDNVTIRALDAYAGLKDRTGDGNYDQAVAGAVLADFQAKGDWTPFGEKYGGVGASGGFSVMKGESLAGAYGSNGIYGAEASANATYLEGNAEVHIGKEGVLYSSAGAEGTVLYAEADAKAEVYTGGSENRYGFYGGANAGAGIAKGSLSSEFDNPFLNVKAHIDGDIGGVGASGNVGIYVDTDDYILNINIGLGVEALLGIEGGLDVSFKFKPFVDLATDIKEFFSPTPQLPIAVGGTILTGCPTVLIG